MRNLVSKFMLLFRLAICLLAYSCALVAESSFFIGNWQSPDRNSQNSNGMEFCIEQRDTGFAGSIHFRDIRGEHEANMLNPKASADTFLFEVDDHYFGRKLSFSMAIQKGGNTALVQSWGGGFLIFCLRNKSSNVLSPNFD